MPRRRYRRQWTGDFTREPIPVYVKKEAQRTEDLIQAAARQKYGQEFPLKPEPPEQEDDGGGLLGNIAGGLGKGLKLGLSILDAAGEYGGRPLFSTLTGANVAERKPLLDDAGQPTGDFYRDAPTIGDSFKSIFSAFTSDPRDTYQQGRQAFQERFRNNPNVGGFERAFIEGVTDPLLIAAAPGTVGRIGATAAAKGIPGATRFLGTTGAPATSRVGRVAGALAEGPARSGVVPLLAGASLGAAAAEKYDIPFVPEAVEQVGATLLGGGLGLKLSPRAKARNQARRSVIEEESGAEKYDPDVVKKRPKVETIPNDQVDVRPEQFQSRNVPEGESFDQARVDKIKENFDPNQVTPGMAVFDFETGKYVVIAGHHRFEALKQLGIEESQWQVFDADLKNADHIEQLKDIGITSNYTTGGTSLSEDINAVKNLANQDDAAGKLSLKKREVDELRAIGEMIPEDIIRRLDIEPEARPQVAEIALAAKAGKFNEPTIRALLRRYGPGGDESGIVRSDLRRTLDKVREVTDLEIQRGAQASMFDVEGTRVLDVIDKMEADLKSLRSERGGIERMIKSIEGLNQTRATRGTLRQAREQMAALEDRVKTSAEEFDTLKREQFEEPRVDEPDVAARAETSPVDEAPVLDVATRPGEPAQAFGSGSGSVLRTSDDVAKSEPPRDEPDPQARAETPEPDAPRPEAPPLDTTNPHTILGIDPKGTFTEDELRKAYRAQARQYHPDLNGSATAKEDMQAINRAFERLSGDLGAGRAERAGGSADDFNQTKQEARAEAKARARATRDQFTKDQTKKRRAQGEERNAESDRQRARREDRTRRQDEAAARDARAAGDDAGGGGRGDGERAAGTPEAAAEPFDFLRVRSRADYVRDAAKALKSRVGRLGLRLTGSRTALGSPEIEGFRRLKDETDHIVTELTGQQADELFDALDSAGMKFVESADGNRYVLDGTDASLADIIEESTDAGAAAYANLNDQQRGLLDRIQDTNAEWNRTIEYHGGEVPKVDTVSGDFMPRRVIAADLSEGFVDKFSGGTGQGRSVGGRSLGGRSQTSEQAGSSKFKYDSPREAFRAGMRNKARIAQDHALTRYAETLRASSETKTGFDARSLRGNHPAFETAKVTGKGKGGANFIVKERWTFSPETADALDDILTPTSIASTKLGSKAAAVNTVTIPIRASMDISFMLNQGLGFLSSSPRNFAKAIKAGVDVVRSASGDPEAYRRILADETARTSGILADAGMTADNPVGFHIQRGLHYASDPTAEDFLFSVGIEQFVGKAGVPGRAVSRGIRWSNETFARYLNYARLTLANDTLERAVKSGLRDAELDSHLQSANRSVNRMTGWSSTKPTGIERMGMFAPRFFRSQVEQIAVAATKGDIEGKTARLHLARVAAVGAVVVIAVNEARGYETEYDPRDHNFMRLRNVFGLDVSPYGSYATLMRGMAQVVGGGRSSLTIGLGVRTKGGVDTSEFETGAPDLSTILDFARAKSGPAAGTLWSIAQGETFQGRPIERDIIGNPLGVAKSAVEIAAENLPFSVQALAENDPLGDPLGALASGLTSATGAQGSFVTPAEKRDFRRDELAQEKYDVDYDELLGNQRQVINQDSEVQEHQDEVDRRGTERVGDNARRSEVDVTFRTKMEANGSFLLEGKDSGGNPFSGNDYREAYEKAAIARRGALDVLDTQGGNPVIEGYFELYAQAEMENGQTDYELFFVLEAAYVEDHPDALAEIDKVVGSRDDDTAAQFRIAREQAREYYKIPPILGLSLEDGLRANAILRISNGLTAAGAATSRRQALALMLAEGQITEDEARTAIRAGRIGGNPARKRFRLANNEFRTFYSDAPNVAGFDVVNQQQQDDSVSGGLNLNRRRERGSSRSRTSTRRGSTRRT